MGGGGQIRLGLGLVTLWEMCTWRIGIRGRERRTTNFPFFALTWVRFFLKNLTCAKFAFI